MNMDLLDPNSCLDRNSSKTPRNMHSMTFKNKRGLLSERNSSNIREDSSISSLTDDEFSLNPMHNIGVYESFSSNSSRSRRPKVHQSDLPSNFSKFKISINNVAKTPMKKMTEWLPKISPESPL